MATQYRKLVSRTVVPTTGVITTKTVLAVVAGETEDQRHKRLKAQAAANRIRVTALGNDRYSVTSQGRADDGTRDESHMIVPNGGKWFCSCTFASHHPGSECSHIAQLRSYRVRKGMSEFPVSVARPRRERLEWIEEV